MNWWEWVFSGIGASVVILLIQRWLKSPSEGKANLTAQGARVSNSPVASGTGITQNVNETHHHHYPPHNPPDEAALPTVAPAEPRPDPIPNLRITGANNILVFEGLDQSFYQADGDQGHIAAVINVTNDARQDMKNVGARVKATLIFHKPNGQELLRVVGAWLAQRGDFVDFKVDEMHRVIVGISDGHDFAVPGKRRIRRDFRHVLPVTDVNKLAVEQTVVTVRLTDADTGDFFCECRCKLQTMPLEIEMQS